MPKTSPSNADAIRNWVADNFNDVGEFSTNDVAENIEGVEVKAAGNISASLQTWADRKKIVHGFRLRRKSPAHHTAVWEIFPAKASPERDYKNNQTKKTMVGAEIASTSPSESFVAEIIHHDGPSRLVKHDGKLYKVTPFKY